MPPGAKSRAKSNSGSAPKPAAPDPQAKASAKPAGPKAGGPEAKSPEPRAKTKAKAQPEAQPSAAQSRALVERAELLLRECLKEEDVARVDGRVLDIAVRDGRLKGVDQALLAQAEVRLEEWRAFEAELQRRAEDLRRQKAAAIAEDNGENELFAAAFAARREMKKEVEHIFACVEDADLDKLRGYLRDDSGGGEGHLARPPLPFDVEDHEGNTPLSEAACYGEAEMVLWLLAAGAHPDARNVHGKTPLWRATYNGHEGVVRLLLEHGADPGIENNDGEPPGKYGTAATNSLIAGWSDERRAECCEAHLSPLQRLQKPWPRLLLEASRAGDAEAALLIARAVPVERTDTQGSTSGLLRTLLDFENLADALWTSCTKGHAELCRALLAARADANSFSEGGLTCLMIACRKGHAAVMSSLLEGGAKTHLRSEQGRLATDYAREVGHHVHDALVAHCRRVQDWTTLEEEARQAGGNRVCGSEAVEGLLETRRNAAASDAATQVLRTLPAEEIREGGDRYQRLLEERALADVLGLG